MSKTVKVPHVIPYQGSKRKLADVILSQITYPVHKLYEPFAGSAAITLACASQQLASEFVIADKLDVLAQLWNAIINHPEELSERYSTIWHAQAEDPNAFYLQAREKFNRDREPAALLYLLARCVKNAVRFNNKGEFNQGADRRRLGVNPVRIKKDILAASSVLKGKTTVLSGDFREILENATSQDLVYLDPPYQGTSGKRDPRYAFLLQVDELIAELSSLNERGIPFILSFDGTCGDRSYGDGLPKFLEMKRLKLPAGRSAQATLLGRVEETVESLYLSPSLLERQSKRAA